MDIKAALVNVLQKIKFATFTNSSPANGELWFDGTDVSASAGGATRKLTATQTAHGVLIGNGLAEPNVTGAGTAGQLLVSGGASADPSFSSSFIGKTITIYKSTDESVASSTSVQSDDEFVFPIAANEVWEGVWFPAVISAATDGLKVSATIPSGATGRKRIAWGNTGSADSDITTDTGATFQWLTQTYGRITFIVTNGSNAGNVQFRWAQNVSGGANTTMKAGSFLIATRTA